VYEFPLSILVAFAVVSALIAAAGFAYHLLLLIVAWWPRGRVTAQAAEKLHRFAVLIPAHNEELIIGKCIDGCKQLDYPSDHFEVTVVADNCIDDTAPCAAQHGAKVLVRNDAANEGKGHALRFGFDKLLAERCDAILVLDADCAIDHGALKAANARLAAGEMAVQCRNVAGNCDESPIALLMGVANVIENDFFYAPKSRLGGFVLLRGTGMILRRELLERYPWEAVSVVEDAEYSYRLAQGGISVDFLPHVSVSSSFPSSQVEVSSQRQRWFGAGVKAAVKQFWGLIKAAAVQRSLLPLDAAWSSWLMARPLVILELLAAMMLSGTLSMFPEHHGTALKLTGVNLAILAGYGCYAAVGLVHLGMTWRRCRLFLQAPIIVARYLWVAVRSVCLQTSVRWERLPRRA